MAYITIEVPALHHETGFVAVTLWSQIDGDTEHQQMKERHD